jgi:3-phosphoshikimate 1-carboxyvinyltransferase
MDPTFSARKGIGGEISPPADKSLTHRALMLASLAVGESRVKNALQTGDCLSTRKCLESLGVVFEDVGRAGRPPETSVRGTGLNGFREPVGVLDAENSGTLMRLLSGMLAGFPFFAVMTGDSMLLRRPMGRVVEPLRRMGARIEGRAGGTFPPLCFMPGTGKLSAIHYRMPVASAQVKSALLLAGLRADGVTRIEETAGKSRDHTERLLSALGVPIRSMNGSVELSPVREIPAFSFEVPGDISSAAFFLAAAAITGRALEVKDCGLNPSRLGFLNVLMRMGVRVEVLQERSSLEEPIGTVRLDAGSLSGTSVAGSEVPDLIDEIPLVAVLGLFARGRTEVRGASELKHKESDRLAMIGAMAASLGGCIQISEDGFTVEGPQALSPGTVECAGDHRIAMAAAVAGAGISGGVKVPGFEAARVSYPDFIEDFRKLGGRTE